jgi:hypothetical protein
MKVRKTLALTLMLVLTSLSVAMAAPGTNKARGIYNRGGWESGGGMSRSRSSYSYRAPATYSAPMVQAAPAPMVAEAPAEERRFSYAPSQPATGSSPCPQGQAHAVTPAPGGESGRRYSYAPAVESMAPSTSPARTYYSSPSYSSGGRGARSTVDRWALPKTDARKYNSR